MEAREAESRELFHGLVNIATGFYHYRMNNRAGMHSQLRKGIAKLRLLPKHCRGVAVERLLNQVAPFVEGLDAGKPLPATLPRLLLYEENPPS